MRRCDSLSLSLKIRKEEEEKAIFNLSLFFGVNVSSTTFYKLHQLRCIKHVLRAHTALLLLIQLPFSVVLRTSRCSPRFFFLFCRREEEKLSLKRVRERECKSNGMNGKILVLFLRNFSPLPRCSTCSPQSLSEENENENAKKVKKKISQLLLLRYFYIQSRARIFLLIRLRVYVVVLFALCKDRHPTLILSLSFSLVVHTTSERVCECLTELCYHHYVRTTCSVCVCIVVNTQSNNNGEKRLEACALEERRELLRPYNSLITCDLCKFSLSHSLLNAKRKSTEKFSSCYSAFEFM